MKPYYQDDYVTLYQGNVFDVLPKLEPESIQCCVTSPPYWGLRDYGTAAWEGGDPECDHKRESNLKPKDLVGVPWRLAFSLQSTGWYLRSDIIWNKPNPMPESVTDRPTKAHEYIFLMAKNQKYYYDQKAIKEPSTKHPSDWNSDGTQKRESGDKTQFFGKTKIDNPYINQGFRSIKEYKNKRTVWTVTTQPYSKAHFATFPPKLIEPCILAGCPEAGAVLDPFAGSGTTGAVAKLQKRRAVLIELNEEYCEMIIKRVKAVIPGDALQTITKNKWPEGGLL